MSYVSVQQERLGSAASGRVYVLFPRGLEAAGPGSPDAHLEPDELSVWPNEQLTIINRDPPGETEWMLAENSEGKQGLIPRSHISCYPLVRVPPASLPIPEPPPTVAKRLPMWDDFDDCDQFITNCSVLQPAELEETDDSAVAQTTVTVEDVTSVSTKSADGIAEQPYLDDIDNDELEDNPPAEVSRLALVKVTFRASLTV